MNTTTNSQTSTNKPIVNSNNINKNVQSNTTEIKPVFSATDLWNIHKTVRTAYARRRNLIH